MKLGEANMRYDQRAAAQWIFAQQRLDCGFPGSTDVSDSETTINAVLAMYALGLRIPHSRVLARARDYLVTHGPAYAALGPGKAAHLDLANVAVCDRAGNAALRSGGTAFDNVRFFQSNTGTEMRTPDGVVPIATPGDIRGQAFILLALAATYSDLPDSALNVLRATQCPNGGWAADGSADNAAADALTTALVVQAVEAIGLGGGWSGPALERDALAFLRLLQAPGGGFALTESGPRTTDPSATAAVIQAIVAAGDDASASEWGNPLQRLIAFQTSAGGFLRKVGDELPDLVVTLHAIPAMLEHSLTIAYLCAEE